MKGQQGALKKKTVSGVSPTPNIEEKGCSLRDVEWRKLY